MASECEWGPIHRDAKEVCEPVGIMCMQREHQRAALMCKGECAAWYKLAQAFLTHADSMQGLVMQDVRD